MLRQVGRAIGGVAAGLLTMILVALPASADRMTSTNFTLNGNINSSFGGQGTSTHYGMFSTGGEPVIGNGASGSYMLGAGFTAQSQQSIQLTVQPSGLLGYWNFDEPGNSNRQFDDGSSNKADARKTSTNEGDLTSTTGKIGNAIAGSGAHGDSSILIPSDSIQPSSVTMEIWFNPSSLPNEWNSLCSYYAKPGEDWGPFELYTDGDNGGNTIAWALGSSGNTSREISTTPNTITTGSWQHIVGTYDAATGTSRIYINGVEKKSQTFSPGSISYTSANPDNKISCFNNVRWSGEGVIGALDHLKIFNRALTANEVKAEYNAQNTGVITGLTLGTVTPGASNTTLQDVIVRTDSGQYGVTLSQDHNLQKGIKTIPAISASIASPAGWSEGTTKGLGFTLLSAPGLDGKWSSGANYAAIPGSATSFYIRSGHTSGDTIDTISSRLRLDTTVSQEAGDYSNTVTYTGTTIP
jgi:hypothetical protein